jgi:uncharacterized protein YpuA (DUF1002 family)
MIKKLRARSKIFAFILAGLLLLPSLAYASGGWNRDKETYVYGVALNQTEIEEVAEKLGLDLDKVNTASVNGADLEKYIGYSTDDSNMISSVSVEKLKEGSGIRVNIKTPDKITTITEGQYTNAAITAGITDAVINVASPKVVTGESALVGVYKAIELNGENVDTQRTEVAQEELATLKEVSQENDGKENFDKDKLDTVVVEVKQKLQEHKEENGGALADANQIRIYIEDALNNVKMGDILSNNNIEILVNYFEKYQNTSAIDSQAVKENLSKLAGQVKEGASKIYNDNKEQIDQMAEDAKESGLWDQIVEFFQSLLNSIKEVFGSSSDSQE